MYTFKVFKYFWWALVCEAGFYTNEILTMGGTTQHNTANIEGKFTLKTVDGHGHHGNDYQMTMEDQNLESTCKIHVLTSLTGPSQIARP